MTKAKKKILPSLGGINKNYLKKSKILKRTLEFLAKELIKIDKSHLNALDKEKFNNIIDDLLKISNYEKTNKIKFYLECLNVVTKY